MGRTLPRTSLLRRAGAPTAEAFPRAADFSPQAPSGPPPAAFPVPHAYTFGQIWNLASKSYRWRSDEALRDDWVDALKVRRDPLVAELLFKRKCPTISLPWHVEPDDPSDPKQQEVAAELTRMVEAIPRFQQYRAGIEERQYYGKAAVEQFWGRAKVRGQWRVTVVDHVPINGDKVRFHWDGTPGIQVNPGFVPERGNKLAWDDRGACLFLSDPYYRDSFAVGTFCPADLDFFRDADLAGSARGLGLRHYLYWPWYLRCEVVRWLGEALQRFGTNGIWAGFFEEGNDASKRAVLEGLAMLTRDNMAAFPRRAGQSAEDIFTSIEPAGIQYDVMQAFIEYLDGWMRLLVVGQTLSGETGATGMGSGVAELQGSTFEQIVRFDSVDHEEILTRELLRPMVRLNGWDLDFNVRFRLGTDRGDRADRMEAIKEVSGLGLPVDAEEVYDAAGIAPPKDAANTVQPTPDEQEGQGTPDGEEGGQPSPPRQPQPPAGRPSPTAAGVKAQLSKIQCQGRGCVSRIRAAQRRATA